MDGTAEKSGPATSPVTSAMSMRLCTPPAFGASPEADPSLALPCPAYSFSSPSFSSSPNLFIYCSVASICPASSPRSSYLSNPILAVTLPLGGSLIMTVLQQTEIHKYRIPAYKTIISIQNLFPFPVIASMLVDLKIMNTELGRLALASALISDMVSNLSSTLITYGRVGIMSFADVIMIHSTFMTMCLILFILCVGRPLSLWIIQNTPEGKPVSRFHVVIMAFLVFVVVLLTDNVGLNYQYGPFLLGLAVPDGPPLGATLVDRLETLVSGLLAPLLVTFYGMNVNLVELFDLEFVGMVWVIVGLCLGMKLVSVFVPAVVCKVLMKDAVVLSFIMSAEGVVQMAFYYYNYVNQNVHRLPGKRHPTHLHQLRAPHARLHHRVDDAVAVQKVLEASYPSKESPMAVYALHLLELAGRANPQLTDHQLGQKSTGEGRAQKMIDILTSFEQQYAGALTIQQFTAMSLTKFIHHNICTLAFNKLASMIILPFHRKWNQQGKVEQTTQVEVETSGLESQEFGDNTSEDVGSSQGTQGTLRSINCEVFELAPCSVAVLIDRHKVRRRAAAGGYTVGVAFFGGADDREALAYARRMARSPDVSLTVVRLVPWDIYAGDNQWDAVLDVEILKDTRMQTQDDIVYREERVKDGAETALLIHAMEEAFDLILVGRMHKEDTPQLIGLSEWDDLPELGPVGDMLAAPDLTLPLSILVVQHQNIKSI
ncbi:hypothetical protein SASPL_100723 [Salvia splendens]|uniref:Cation/H+ exchanger domain-containing protein n=1 Tax=Salvia splendens TaxID=180675 RepID=A0A8X8YPM0_SALSN|nr:hypothetical protein SASPL_100723 [Salvia splendens]